MIQSISSVKVIQEATKENYNWVGLRIRILLKNRIKWTIFHSVDTNASIKATNTALHLTFKLLGRAIRHPWRVKKLRNIAVPM